MTPPFKDLDKFQQPTPVIRPPNNWDGMNLWNEFEIKTMGDFYSGFYLKTNVLLLSDVFENFMKNVGDITNSLFQ